MKPESFKSLFTDIKQKLGPKFIFDQETSYNSNNSLIGLFFRCSDYSYSGYKLGYVVVLKYNQNDGGFLVDEEYLGIFDTRRLYTDRAKEVQLLSKIKVY